MGCASSAAATPEEAAAVAASKEIDDALKKERPVIKILLLGAGDSGKSTVMKQLRHIHLSEFKRSDQRREYAPIAARNLAEACELRLGAVKAALEGSGAVVAPAAAYPGLPKRLLEYHDRLVAVAAASRDTATESAVPPDLETVRELRMHYKAIERTNPEIHRATELAASEAGTHFFAAAERVLAENYVPTVEDCIRCRVRTTGIVEASFEVEGNLFRIVDVGGQRTERRKWIHCFEGVHVVIFCASVVEYDQRVPEDDKAGRLDESLEVFRETCEYDWFEKTIFVLFLNKCDLLKDRLRKSPFKDHCPRYRGENDPDAVLKFLETQYVERNTEGRTVYAHVTCATDTEGVRFVFKAVRDTVVRQFMAQMGL